MPREVHGDEGARQGEGGDDAAGYEEGLQAEGADVGDEGDVGVGLAGVAGAALGEPVDEEREEGDGPDDAGG